GRTEPVRRAEAIRHDPDIVAARDRRDGRIEIGRSRPVQGGADPRQVVEAPAHPTKLAGPDQARQSLVDRRPAAEIQEILGRAYPSSLTMGPHATHDFVSYASHLPILRLSTMSDI